MSKIEEQVIKKIRQRAEIGEKKYGVTMERTDFTDAKWLKELQAELLDGAIYAEKLLTLIKAHEEGLVKCPIPLEKWPKWAKWAAMDESQWWYFYKLKPKVGKANWCNAMGFPVADFKGSDLPWADTLTHRSELEKQKHDLHI